MSDFDDDLLALAEGSTKKVKSAKSKRKREVVAQSE